MSAEPINKTLLYTYDFDADYSNYNSKHGTDYPYNSFPKGQYGRTYKKTRFKDWNPLPEDIIIRHYGSQIHVNFSGLFDQSDFMSPAIQLFQMRSKRVDLQNYICEQINFFTALYDDDNDLITSMLVAKIMTDSQTYTITTFDEYYKELYKTLFPQSTMDKIRKMVDENDVGDDIIGLFPTDFLRDMFIISFQMKVMHIFIEHFIISTGNSPKDMYELFATAYTYAMYQINDQMYPMLYDYVNRSITQAIKSNTNIYDMQAIEGVTAPTTVQAVMRKTILCDGLIKLTFASEWDKINKRPRNSCVGLIKSVISGQASNSRKTQLRYTLVNKDDVSQLLSETVGTNAPISMIRSLNPGEHCCTLKDLNIIIAHIALEIDLSPVDYYLQNLPAMNDLSQILIDTVLYNKFHSSISTENLDMKQRYILLLYVRHLIMDLYFISEEQSTGDEVINILMGRATSQSTKTLTQKDLSQIKKYVKLNNLKQYLLSEANVKKYTEDIMRCVLASYTIVNHNDPSLLNTPLVYESGTMTLKLLDVVVTLFEHMK